MSGRPQGMGGAQALAGKHVHDDRLGKARAEHSCNTTQRDTAQHHATSTQENEQTGVYQRAQGRHALAFNDILRVQLSSITIFELWGWSLSMARARG